MPQQRQTQNAQNWVPEGFERYRERYPATPPFVLPDLTPTHRFAAIWREFEDSPHKWPAARHAHMTATLRDTTFIIIRGFLGNTMPGNSRATLRALRTLNVDAWIANNRAGASVDENAHDIADQIRRRVPKSQRVFFLGHSRGGLESLQVAAEPDIAPRVAAVVMSQTPRGPSAVLESLLLNRHQQSLIGLRRIWAERLQTMGLYMMGVQKGGRELTTEELSAVIRRVDGLPRPRALLQTASWSSRATAWLDSFHERLGEIRPQCAHDGQFYVQDLIWPDIPHLLLPHVDHAQPVMGGFGFDDVRYWLAAITLIVDQYLEMPNPAKS